MDISGESGLVILGIIGLFGNTIAVVIGSYLTSRNATRAQREATDAKLAVVRAEEQSAVDQKDASDSVQKIVSGIVRVEKVASDTHIMLRALFDLASRVSKENPDDKDAALAMKKVASDLHDVEVIEGFLKRGVWKSMAANQDTEE